MGKQIALPNIDTFLNRVFHGDALTLARSLPPQSIDCVVTSPPYFGLRDYGHPEQIGLEATPQAYIARLVELFDLIHKAIKPSGTVWLNLGDSYSTSGGRRIGVENSYAIAKNGIQKGGKKYDGFTNKSLMLIPARVAIALQERGWILRSEIIWHKPAPMPESVKDRPTKAHEVIYLLTKAGSYWYDQTAISPDSLARFKRGVSDHHKYTDGAKGQTPHTFSQARPNDPKRDVPTTANLRDVWTIASEPSSQAHYASYPTEIPRRCIRLGCPPAGVVYDPFMGTGTTAAVAIEQGRAWVGSELNADYVAIIQHRLSDVRKQKALANGQTVELAPNVNQLGMFSERVS